MCSSDLVEQDDTYRSETTLTSGQRTLLGGERMAKALDRIRMEMTDAADEAASERQDVVSAAEGVMLATSLGWLALLLRAESLAALAFSALPMWRKVDPLAILSLSDEEREQRMKDLKKARAEEDAKLQAIGRLLDRR